MEFLNLFLTGKPVQDVMDTMRARHFPLSLLYSVYTYPFVQLEPGIQDVPVAALNPANLSFEHLGSRRM